MWTGLQDDQDMRGFWKSCDPVRVQFVPLVALRLEEARLRRFAGFRRR